MRGPVPKGKGVYCPLAQHTQLSQIKEKQKGRKRGIKAELSPDTINPQADSTPHPGYRHVVNPPPTPPQASGYRLGRSW